ncbi:BA75_04964T0 [Komagataella pastoris]|uniref:BA75_04964T0 n=1 Tax=Komagataella pastoris TaxID=4922 RepID=A0A1B2JHK2_PICPA|nr:BA75_04964T0 [Komagataella pastoris]
MHRRLLYRVMSTLESQLKSTDGSVLVNTSTGKIKVRKGQTEEAFLEQKQQFLETGPQINDYNWLIEDYDTRLETFSQLAPEKRQSKHFFDPINKVDTENIIRCLNLLYYEKRYHECLQRCQFIIGIEDADLEKNKKFQLFKSELASIKSACESKLS